MKTIGVIMEINPFHNGHKYFLNQIPKEENDILVAVISSTIMQRGEFSILNKHDKASILLENGVDIVIELPAVYSNQGGLFFAKHAIKHLEKLNVTDLYFGSESSDLEGLMLHIKNEVNSSFEKGIYRNSLSSLKSNDILGISYLKNIDRIRPHLIKRVKNNYNDFEKNNSQIQSATFIRKCFSEGQDIDGFLPSFVKDRLKKIDEKILFVLFKNNLSICIDNDINIFLSEKNQLLLKLDKIIKNNNFDSIHALVSFAADKNNSKYKLQRVIINTILMVEENMIEDEIKYIRILGLSKSGSLHLKNITNDIFVTSLKNLDSYVASIEIRVSNLYASLVNENTKVDFLPPIIK